MLPLCFCCALPWKRWLQWECRDCPRAVTLHGLPGTPLLCAGVVNTSDLGVFGGIWHANICFYSSLTTCSLFTELLGSSCPPNKSSGVALCWFFSSPAFAQQTPMQTWLQGTDRVSGIAGLMLGLTYFGGRRREQEQPYGLTALS